MSNPLPDERLMLQVRDGTLERLALLFDRYQSPLFNFFLRLSADRQGAEDMVQEVFVRVLKYRHTFRPGTTFRSWIFQVARNVRRDARPRPRAVPNTEIEPSSDPAHSESSHDTALLEQALMSLPEEKREVLVLSRLQGLSHREIGEVLGCEPETARVRVHRAVQDLRREFQQLTGEALSRPVAGTRTTS